MNALRRRPTRAVHAAAATVVAMLALAPLTLTAHATGNTVTQNLVNDGNFAAGEPQSYWAESQAPETPHYALIDQMFPNTQVDAGNNWSADFCEIDNCGDQVTQPVLVPGQVSQATLIYWYAIASSEGNGNSGCHDSLQAGLGVNSLLDGGTQQRRCSVTQSNGSTVYVQASLDVTGYFQSHAGQTIDVIFRGNTDDLNASQFFVDDVSLSTTYVAVPSAPRNPTASSTAPGSATVSWSAPLYPLGSSYPVTSYTVTPYIDGSPQNNLAQSVAGSSTTYTFNGTLQNATTYTFGVTATNANGTGLSAPTFSVTPRSNTPPATQMSATSAPTSQRRLPSSDGATWQDIDGNNLALSFTPASNGEAILTGNADLWTSTAGVNQDIGLWVNGSTIAWKESGGGAAYAPNAALVQAAIPVTAGTPYSVRLVWKSNVPAMGVTIWAGAGGPGAFSPSRLAVQLSAPFTSSTGVVATSAPTKQFSLAGSDGTSWQPVDNSTFGSLSVSPAGPGTLLISGNADLWTSQAGTNQDIGLQVNGTVVAWKESGGGAAFAPDAAYVVNAYNVTGAGPLALNLVWKSNHATSSTIFAGAGQSGGFSPTSLTAVFIPQATGVNAPTVVTKPSTTQYWQTSGDGSTWNRMDWNDGGHLTATFTTPTTGGAQTWFMGVNADLWTTTVGYNQDIGICVTQGPTVGSCSGSAIVGWKESGGLLAPFAPNAAMLQSTVSLLPNTQYTVTVVWKANVAYSSGAIYAAAGGPNNFSPTTLLLQLAA